MDKTLNLEADYIGGDGTDRVSHYKPSWQLGEYDAFVITYLKQTMHLIYTSLSKMLLPGRKQHRYRRASDKNGVLLFKEKEVSYGRDKNKYVFID